MLFATTESRNLCRISARSRSSNQLAVARFKEGLPSHLRWFSLIYASPHKFYKFHFSCRCGEGKGGEGGGGGALIEAEKNCAAREFSLPSGMVKKSSITLKPRGGRTVVFRQAPKLSESALTPTALKLFKRCPATVTPR